ncbi:arylamine N-acetyltransferase family protein [Paenibacillus gorillae]|uniref:arylamine N-acetyltransferase family protein n=1 Tax=Paenibacillus gorillae TaxID=1243662 RepID=UPI0007B9EF6F|nr:arylamine N-acetyltransferase [Paenibacillus gorillae]
MLLNEHMRDGYLSRLGKFVAEPPTLSYLQRLHRAHVEKISWQTIDIFARRTVSIHPQHSVQLINGQRSGYCFQLNGAFSLLLRSLGFKVTYHDSGIQPLGQQPRIDSFHVGLLVEITNEQGEPKQWIADVGLGDMLYDPVPLLSGSYQQGGFLYHVTSSEAAEGGWRLVHAPGYSYAGVDFAPEPLPDLNHFTSRHHHYCHAPESPWLRVLLLQNRHAGGSNELRGCIWKSRTSSGVEITEMTSKSQWLEMMADIFHEPLTLYSASDKDALWNKVSRMHEEWKTAKKIKPADQRLYFFSIKVYRPLSAFAAISVRLCMPSK